MQDIKIPQTVWLYIVSGFLLSYSLVVIIIPELRGSIDPFETYLLMPRVLFIGLISLIGILQAKGWKSYYNTFSLLILGQLLFTGISSLLVQDDLQFKLLGPDRRMDGLLYQVGLSFFALFVYRIARNQEPRFRKILLGTIFLSIFLQAIIVILENYDIRLYNPTLLGLPRYRINGSIGHYGMVAGFLLPGILLGFLMTRKSTKLARALTIIGMIVMAYALGITGNRSSYIALLVCLPLIFLLRRNISTLFLLLTLAIIPMQLPTGLLQAAPSQIGFNAAERSVSTVTTRLAFWNLALFKVIPNLKLFPIFGGGSDALLLSLIRDLPPEEYIKVLGLELGWDKDKVSRFEVLNEEGGGTRDTGLVLFFKDADDPEEGNLFYYNLDKAHNFIIDRLIAYGLLNTLIWIFLYTFPLIIALRTKNQEQKLIAVILLSVALYYQAWFPVVSVEPYHVALLALAWAMWSSQKETEAGFSLT